MSFLCFSGLGHPCDKKGQQPHTKSNFIYYHHYRRE